MHKKYQRTANVENKQLFRIHMKARVADEKVYADSIDSVTMRRAKVEAMNIIDRQPLTDTAWPVEKSKIEGKLSIFQSNINNIMPYGGTSEDYRQWKNIYNCIQTAIKVTRESYQDSGKKKREYLAIYKDIVGRKLSSHPASFDLEQYQESQGDAKEQQTTPAIDFYSYHCF